MENERFAACPFDGKGKHHFPLDKTRNTKHISPAMTIKLSPASHEKIKSGYIAARDVMEEIQSNPDLIFPDKPAADTSLKEIKFKDGSFITKAVFDKVDGLLIIS